MSARLRQYSCFMESHNLRDLQYTPRFMVPAHPELTVYRAYDVRYTPRFMIPAHLLTVTSVFYCSVPGMVTSCVLKS